MWPFSKKPEVAIVGVLKRPRFAVGDYAIMNKFLNKKNPYKGCLRAGRPYRILGVYTTSHIKLLADNGTEGYFASQHFDLYEGIGIMMPLDLSGEYDDAIAAQEAMEGL
jgi:hypothetical protein